MQNINDLKRKAKDIIDRIDRHESVEGQEFIKVFNACLGRKEEYGNCVSCNKRRRNELLQWLLDNPIVDAPKEIETDKMKEASDNVKDYLKNGKGKK